MKLIWEGQIKFPNVHLTHQYQQREVLVAGWPPLLCLLLRMSHLKSTSIATAHALCFCWPRPAGFYSMLERSILLWPLHDCLLLDFTVVYVCFVLVFYVWVHLQNNQHEASCWNLCVWRIQEAVTGQLAHGEASSAQVATGGSVKCPGGSPRSLHTHTHAHTCARHPPTHTLSEKSVCVCPGGTAGSLPY